MALVPLPQADAVPRPAAEVEAAAAQRAPRQRHRQLARLPRLVRRQALREAEPFWSVPTRRVTQALAPPFVIGLVSGAVAAFSGSAIGLEPTLVAIIWIVAYGCGLSAAGFFMQRGIKLLGWIFVISGASLLVGYGSCPWLKTPQAAHYLMGIFFGLLHLAYGIYLYFTEKGRKSA